MKIAIAKLETPAEILDLDYATGGEILGGATFGSTNVEVGATGEKTFTDAQTFALSIGVPLGQGKTGSVTITGGFGIATDF
jgi:hypothetical protein